jgi:hypothetical protein
MTPKTHVALLASLVLVLTGCEVEKGLDLGGVVDGVYTNKDLGLKLPIPQGWFVADRETQQRMMQAGEAMVASDSPAAKSAVEASKATTFNLLSLSQFEVGSAVEFNPTLVRMAERVSHVPGIKSGADYLFHAAQLLKSTLAGEVTKETHAVQLAGSEWHRIDYRLQVLGRSISQAYICIKRGDYVIAMVLSAGTPEQMTALEQAAASIRLESGS